MAEKIQTQISFVTNCECWTSHYLQQLREPHCWGEVLSPVQCPNQDCTGPNMDQSRKCFPQKILLENKWKFNWFWDIGLYPATGKETIFCVLFSSARSSGSSSVCLCLWLLGILPSIFPQSSLNLPSVSQQSLSSLSAVSQQSLSSLSTVSRQNLSRNSAVSQQSLSSLSVVSQQSLSSLSAVS